MELRRYQREIIRDVGKSGGKDVAIVMPTGAGKSVVINELVNRYVALGHKCVVLTSRKALVSQLYKHLDVPTRVISAGEHVDVDNAMVSLVMEQSLGSEHVDCDVLIRDEIHEGFTGRRFNDIVDRLKPKKIIGLTATPVDEKGVLLFDDSWEIIENVDVASLVDMGYLVKPEYIIPKYSELQDYSGVPTTGGDYNLKQLSMVLNTEKHNSFVADKVIHERGDKKTIIFTTTVEHAEGVYRALKAYHGVRVGITHSKLNNADLELYKAGMLDILVSVSKLTTGFDDTATEMVVLVRPTKIKRLYIQMVGRGLRLHPGKESCIILDLSRGLSTHGFVDIPESRAKEFSTDGVGDIVSSSGSERLTKDKVLEYNLRNKTTRVDELIAENELLKIKIKQLEEAENSESRLHELMMSADNPYDVLKYGNELCGIAGLQIARQATIDAVVEDFESTNLDLSVMKNRMNKIVEFEAGTWEDGSYRAISSMKTYFTWYERNVR